MNYRSDYNALRLYAGWMVINPQQAQAGLDDSAFIIAANDGDKTVSVARLCSFAAAKVLKSRAGV